MNILKADRPQLSFSKASERYEESSDLQKRIGIDLLSRIPGKKTYLSILDVGMGTGWLTERIGIKFPDARLFGVDLAPGMVLAAKDKNIDVVLQADAQSLPFEDSSFDLVVSNCAYQWVNDLEKAFASSRRVLRQEGDFYFSCFGKQTLKELWASFKNVSRDSILRDERWDSLDQNYVFNTLASSGFKDIDVCREIEEIKFDDMFDLIRWLKTIGANQVKRSAFVGRDILNQANKFYQDHYSDGKRICASFEVIKAKARK
ncbi:MAG: methyltransferase domain-containing protein [Candidatus Omnitrophica bacterium]|nr:methyltransferase domain-containing protein [Candidatus Omnitrophota bacterium]